MATIGNSFLGLIDAMRAGDQAGLADVAEVLHKMSPVYRNAFFVEANKGAQHYHSIRTGLPSVAWGRLYQGIPQSKSSRTMVTDSTGFVEGLSTVDERLLKISKNAAALRLQEGDTFIESIAQEVESGFFYHDVVATPEKFRGLAARYSVTGGSGAGNQIVDAGGAGSDNTSIWFVTWGERATHLIHPEGTTSGLEREDMGRQRVLDEDGNPYYVQEEMFRQHIGVAVRDWRHNARIANIDVSDLEAGNVDLYKWMRKAFYKLPSVWATSMVNKDGTFNQNASLEGRTVIYMNRTALEALDATGTNSSNGALQLKPMELEGKIVPSYRGIPIEVTDALLNTEAAVA